MCKKKNRNWINAHKVSYNCRLLSYVQSHLATYTLHICSDTYLNSFIFIWIYFKMKSQTLSVAIITVSCLLIALSSHANAQSDCSSSCSDDNKRCTATCVLLSRSEEQKCANYCYDQHVKCQKDCLSVSGRFLRRDEDLLEKRFQEQFYWIKSTNHGQSMQVACKTETYGYLKTGLN